jgi:hypothetical protein
MAIGIIAFLFKTQNGNSAAGNIAYFESDEDMRYDNRL